MISDSPHPCASPSSFPYPSRRVPVFAKNVVATSQPLAAQAGLNALRRGGNAADAALATAITLTIVEPNSNGIGSDAFMLLWDGKKLHGLNASGKSPAAWRRDHFPKDGQMPLLGWDTVTVPGAVSAWEAVSRRFGKLPFADLFTDAIAYARDGFFVGPTVSRAWGDGLEIRKQFSEFKRVFFPEGRAPQVSEMVRLPDHARTLEKIAAGGADVFYRGELARTIAAASKADGAFMTGEDLAAHEAQWVEPLSLDYRGDVLHEIPPNGQGIAAQIALGLLRHFDLAAHEVDSADSLHLQIEAMKLALADAYRHVADPRFMRVSPAELLDESYLASRAKLIRMDHAAPPQHGVPQQGGTVLLAAADAEGMMVSFIQSNFGGFGSGIVIPGTGISLQNRGHGFSLESGHVNEVAGGKRPFHTIIPGFVMRGGAPLMAFGVMGGSMQAQGHVQMMVRIRDYGQNPQAASDARRWQVFEGMRVALEEGTSPAVAAELQRRGHQIEFMEPRNFGGAQLIMKTKDGYCAASDHRKDGQAVGF